MIELKSYKGKRIDGVKIDEQDIFINDRATNLFELEKMVRVVDKENIDDLLKIAKSVFMPDSYKLIEYLSLEDFIKILEMATKEIQSFKDNQKFQRLQ